jgi:DNA-binding GntR family transcriptional regulator
MRTLDDRQVYRRLIALEGELLRLAEAVVSPRSETALRAAAAMIRKLASAFFKASN